MVLEATPDKPYIAMANAKLIWEIYALLVLMD
jgi:hypothetical protein